LKLQQETWVFDHTEIEECVSYHLFINHRQPEIADKTRNTYIAETTTKSMEISTANVGFMTMEKCQT